MADVTRVYDKSPNQSFTYDAIGHAEDISPILTNISPEVTLFYSKFGNAEPATATSFGWMTIPPCLSISSGWSIALSWKYAISFTFAHDASITTDSIPAVILCSNSLVLPIE